METANLMVLEVVVVTMVEEVQASKVPIFLLEEVTNLFDYLFD
jgi:hypothetical protein